MKKEPLILPEAEGQVTTLTEKVYVPVREHPDVSTILIYILLVCPPEMCMWLRVIREMSAWRAWNDHLACHTLFTIFLTIPVITN